MKTIAKNRHSFHQERNRKGSVLIVVIALCIGLSIVAGSALESSFASKKINARQRLWIEAKNAAESIVEYGAADLADRLRSQVSFPSNELSPGNNPLTIPSDVTTFYTGTNIDTSKFTLRGGTIPSSGTTIYIDPTDEKARFDPMKGKTAFIREIAIYGKANATNANGVSVDAYCVQKLQVRDSALFSHAVFYNLDLEFHPGPQMDMQGPVHSNNDIYLNAVNRLSFHGNLTSAQDIYRLYKGTGTLKQGGTIRIKNGSDSWVNMDSTMDSRNSDWEAKASELWDGNVLSVDHGIQPLNPVSIEDYVPDDPATSGTNELRNYGYSLLEPQLGTSSYDSDSKGTTGESLKFSANAGLILRITDMSDPNGWTLSTYQRANVNEPISDSNPPTLDSNGKPIEIAIPVSGTTFETLGIVTNKPYALSGSTVTSGLYDQRQKAGQSIVEIDIGKLRQVLDDNHASYVGPADFGNNYDPSKQFNGLLYVEMPLATPAGSTSHTSRPDNIRISQDNIAVQIINGQDIPDPDYNKTSGRNEGFTLATNGALYVKGHYNSDGNLTTGSSTSPDNKGNGQEETPAALIADAITVLSNSFNETTSKSSTKPTASSTEVSAAFLTGLVPTIPGTSAISGGAHNFPRFLEKWSSKTLLYRGSLVALFESEIHEVAMYNTNHYSPPTRDWGFHDYFKAGRFPPGTPYTRDFARIDFRDLTKAEYDTAIAALP